MIPANGFSYGALMLMAGIGIPIMASLSAALGGRLGSTPAAAAIVASGSAICLFTAMLATGAVPRQWLGVAPWPYYCAGIFYAIYILSITFVAPKFGIGNAVFFVLLGQLIAASVIDHFGLFGTQQVSIDGRRIAGLCFMAVGVFLARRWG